MSHTKEHSAVTGATAPANAESQAAWAPLAAWVGLGSLLLVNLPAFLSMGLDSDVSMYDLLARRVVLGDVHYRDLLETNFPGIVWLHVVIRSIVGWRSEALRAADFIFVALSAGLLASWVPRPAQSWRRVAVAGGLLAFYLSTSEWAHCQRDMWMLLPALSALRLRASQAERLAKQHVSSWALAGWALGEGMIWASACWIKPFVAVPAAVCWLVSARHAWKTLGPKRRLLVDLVALAAGGLIVGGVGVGWLVWSGAWPAFVEVMFVWNREYFSFNVLGDQPWVARTGFVVRLFPWVLVHLAAVPLAIVALWRPAHLGLSPLSAAFYLAWLSQAVLLQHLFDYVHVPPILLGMAVVAASGYSCKPVPTNPVLPRSQIPRLAATFMVVCLSWSYPGLLVQRAAAWMQCVTEGSTAAVRDRVSLLRRLDWTNLELVEQFLRNRGVRDGEVTSVTLSTVALYRELAVAPSTRYVLLQDHLDIFAKRRSVILTALAASRQKYLVCDLSRYNMQRVRALADGVSRQEVLPVSPEPTTDRADGRLAFRAGNYVVFRVSGAEMPGWLTEHVPRLAE